MYEKNVEGWVAFSRLQGIYEQRTEGENARELGREVADAVRSFLFLFQPPPLPQTLRVVFSSIP